MTAPPNEPRDGRFACYESSGLWDAPVGAWHRAADQLRKAKVGGVKVSIGVHTEVTRDQVVGAFRNQPGNWRYVRMDKGSEEIVLTYDRDLWRIERARAVLVSDTTIYTKAGHLQPSVYMLEVVATFLSTGRRVYFQGLHWPLRNTPARARAWAQCEDKIQHRWTHITAADPNAIVVHLGDINESMRAVRERRRVLELVAGVPGFHQSWNLRKLPSQGTHGRQLIDNCLTNARVLAGGAVLLNRVPKFDHRPLGVLLGVPGLERDVHASLPQLLARPVVEPDTEYEPLSFDAA